MTREEHDELWRTVAIKTDCKEPLTKKLLDEFWDDCPVDQSKIPIEALYSITESMINCYNAGRERNE